LDAAATRSAAGAKILNIQIFRHFRSYPAGQLNAQNCEFIFS
jgi:hypothetical protein